MNSPDQAPKQPDNMELLKQQAAACGPECGCHPPKVSGKTRWVIGVIVLMTAGVLVVRAVTKNDATPTETSTPVVAASATLPASANASEPAGGTAETSVGRILGTLSDLSSVAADTSAVFIFLPGKEGIPDNPPSKPMKDAVTLLESKAGAKCGIFTLKADSPDYAQLAAQMSVPGVVVMVKGGGMAPVSGEITEGKLVQGFLAASRAGGCGAGGCGAGGCGPSGCK